MQPILNDLRPMKKNEAKRVLEGDMVPFYGYWGEQKYHDIQYDLTPGKEYKVELYIPKSDNNNVYFIVRDDYKNDRLIHRRFFGVKA